tara:strand:+ start:259 stop:489 length:231 start_codon:yes stop_codon:yes gene_type:complete
MYHKLLMINSFQLPPDVNNKIMIEYKYNMLETKYRKDYNELIKHMQYYMWLNKKMIKKDKQYSSLLKTIIEFDYYK